MCFFGHVQSVSTYTPPSPNIHPLWVKYHIPTQSSKKLQHSYHTCKWFLLFNAYENWLGQQYYWCRYKTLSQRPILAFRGRFRFCWAFWANYSPFYLENILLSNNVGRDNCYSNYGVLLCTVIADILPYFTYLRGSKLELIILQRENAG